MLEKRQRELAKKKQSKDENKTLKGRKALLEADIEDLPKPQRKGCRTKDVDLTKQRFTQPKAKAS